MKRSIAVLWLAALMIIVCTAGAMADQLIHENLIITIDGIKTSGYYTGETENGEPSGYGIFAAADDSGLAWHYIGFWKNGKMNGEGGIYRNDGSMEYGIYENNALVSGFILASSGKKQCVPLEASAGIQIADAFTQTYIGNVKTKKFHYPECDSVKKMKDTNKIMLNSRQEAITAGYDPCGICDP